ncbi:MAG: leucyl aminopeptidase family protein [Gammaproteobacteria bacterium]|nr:leucyl aminopeptidase family protein [Gammaproteobacteria bacterium]
MPTCFLTERPSHLIPIQIVAQQDYAVWSEAQSDAIKMWLQSLNFRPEIGAFLCVPNDSGQINFVLCTLVDKQNFWQVGHLPNLLPAGNYFFQDLPDALYELYALAWGLGAYQFTRYKAALKVPAKLYLPESVDKTTVVSQVNAIYLIRNLINTPTDDLGPSEFAKFAKEFAEKHQGEFNEIVGETLLVANYPCIYTVGKGSDDEARLVDIRWGNKENPKITLVGKGVCFDTGGLDLKSSAHMMLMKKDMGGGAHVLGLAQMIIEAKLPVSLRVLIPMVENAIDGNSYRPGDVIKTRQGLTVEIGNTDAEGRLVLADALNEGASENPELLIDFATLTGAARIAVGTEIAAVFSTHEKVVTEVMKEGENLLDPIWQLPMYAPYRDLLYSSIADLNNNAMEPYAGATTAALFLGYFVPNSVPWLHFDLMAWNLRTRPGHPQGGEAMGVRAVFSYLKKRFPPIDQPSA